MALLLDLFGYLSVVVHGLVIVAQSMTVGSVLFLVFLAVPIASRVGGEGGRLAARIARLGFASAAGLALAETLFVAMQVAVIADTLDLGVGGVLGANFALAGLVKIAAAMALALLLGARGAEAPRLPLLALALLVLVSAAFTTHSAARIDGRLPLLLLEIVHLFGAALWIGGIPAFLIALASLHGGGPLRLAGARFSRMSMLGVGCLLCSGLAMSVAYIGDLSGLYGTAYGVMVAAKAAMLGLLLLLGLGNFLLVERLKAVPATPIGRMRRFAEAEIGIGFTVFFAAASLTSVPPAVDLTNDRVSWPEIVERSTPRLPRLVSPAHDSLTISTLQAKLDGEAAGAGTKPPAAFVPGSGELPPRGAADIAWSEYNHHWAGMFVLAIGILALLAQAGWRPARHWPLLFVGLGLFLAVRADPDVWPLGNQGLIESLRDVETLQHRAFEILLFAFAFFEWRVRARGLRTGAAPLVFPLMCAAGGALLLTHQHAIANVKDQLLIELSHTPLALVALLAGWSRWLELRLDPECDPRLIRAAAWVWPTCLALIGLILLVYREA